LSQKETADYVIQLDQPVSAFEEVVRSDTGLKGFQIQVKDKETLLMSELIKQNFDIQVGKGSFTVHPNFFSMIDLKHSSEMISLFGNRNIPAMR
jgi:hypothetical protein